MTTSRKRGIVTRNPAAPLAIGVAMVALQLFMYPFSGACFNPVRALASYIATMRLSADFLAYCMGPPIGAFAAAILYLWAFTGRELKLAFDKKL
jgi:glycerol uptake facilitator-like aquaporin